MGIFEKLCPGLAKVWAMEITRLDSDLFTIREEGNLRLIIPSHSGAVANAPWTKQTVQYRSRVETLKGETVSQGFHKFFNLGHGPAELKIGIEDVARACEKGEAVATLKVDGSLLIRSEYEKKVRFRTRGSFGYDHLANADEIEEFCSLYPKLAQPGVFPNTSILFEWVSPRNIIVLKYPVPCLTIIGAVDHYTMKYYKMYELETISEVLEIPVVEYFKLNTEGWKDLQETLDTRQDIEGYVIRVNDEQDLVKVKAAPYVTKHALKSTLTTEKLADMYFQWGRPGYLEFVDKFKAAFDEETTIWAMGAISGMFDGARRLAGIEVYMKFKAEQRKTWSRKEVAMAGLSEYGQTKRFALFMNIWEGKSIRTELLKSILLQSTKQVEISMFAG